jgi:hypothetical protein
MGNQRAKASSGWHLRACGKRDDLTILLLSLCSFTMADIGVLFEWSNRLLTVSV